MDDDFEEQVPTWYAYAGGNTIGKAGPEGGDILRDEEFGDPEDDEDADARLTLEQGRAENPGWILTASLYGWMFQTHKATDKANATAKYEPMKSGLERLVSLLPYEDDKDIDGKVAVLTSAIAEFESAFP